MLGHKVCQQTAADLDVFTSVHTPLSDPALDAIGSVTCTRAVDATSPGALARVLNAVRPDVVVNCIGVVKQRGAADTAEWIAVNALFPHVAAAECRKRDVRFIQISTDCVFSGHAGGYNEGSEPDARDIYGMTKLLGEVTGDGCLTLRTSMIGRTLRGTYGLLEWFLSQEGRTIRGFRRAVFSGFTTLELARILKRVILDCPELEGLYHVAAAPICKYDLLSLIGSTYGVTTRVEPDDTLVCDRSLDGSSFRDATGIVAPDWPAMVDEMYRDPTPYDAIRRAAGGNTNA